MTKRRSEVQRLPDVLAFDPYSGCLDAQAAWREFGGLTIDQAHAKFITNPLHYQEYFMFMGGKAFVYYFPVLDRYLREFRAGDAPYCGNDSHAAIIGSGFSIQLLSPTASELDCIMDRFHELVAHVRGNFRSLATESEEQERIDSHWQILQKQLPSLTAPPTKQG